MTLDEIKNMVNKDAEIDETALDKESIKIPQLHGKYLNFLMDERLIYRKYLSEYDVLKKFKWEYYTGKIPEEELKKLNLEVFPLRILKQDLDLYLDSDTDIINLKNKLELQKQKIEYLESTIKEINSRQWTIKNAISWRMFLNGIN